MALTKSDTPKQCYHHIIVTIQVRCDKSQLNGLELKLKLVITKNIIILYSERRKMVTNKQSECVVLMTQQNLRDSLQEQLQRLLFQSNSVPKGTENNSPRLTEATMSQEYEGYSSTNDQTICKSYTIKATSSFTFKNHDNIQNQDDFNSGDESESSKDERQNIKCPKKSKAQKAKKRKDPRNLSQNISCKAKTIIVKQLTLHSPKAARKRAKQVYQQYLDKNTVACDQLILVFAFFFVRHNTKDQNLFQRIRLSLSAYIKNKLKKSESEADEENKRAKISKFKAHLQLTDYLFTLGEKELVNFDSIREIGQPLFTKRQAGRINDSIEKAREIQNAMEMENQSLFQVLYSQKQCQVDIEL